MNCHVTIDRELSGFAIGLSYDCKRVVKGLLLTRDCQVIALNCDGCVPIWHRIAWRLAEDCQGIGRLLLGDRQRIARGLEED